MKGDIEEISNGLPLDALRKYQEEPSIILPNRRTSFSKTLRVKDKGGVNRGGKPLSRPLVYLAKIINEIIYR